ncbi:hypothetical protein Tsubulata_018493 [Turnera subulata]|uniref:Uncharacterized protein n=1 Tax=Turnera subulata TaxID=218843 RepID=A0A9Q0G5D5_9ROSI|nr:hypothetical protein Tsubulata_018493 [Turnera subulata]
MCSITGSMDTVILSLLNTSSTVPSKPGEAVSKLQHPAVADEHATALAYRSWHSSSSDGGGKVPQQPCRVRTGLKVGRWWRCSSAAALSVHELRVGRRNLQVEVRPGLPSTVATKPRSCWISSNLTGSNRFGGGLVRWQHESGSTARHQVRFLSPKRLWSFPRRRFCLSIKACSVLAGPSQRSRHARTGDVWQLDLAVRNLREQCCRVERLDSTLVCYFPAVFFGLGWFTRPQAKQLKNCGGWTRLFEACSDSILVRSAESWQLPFSLLFERPTFIESGSAPCLRLDVFDPFDLACCCSSSSLTRTIDNLLDVLLLYALIVSLLFEMSLIVLLLFEMSLIVWLLFEISFVDARLNPVEFACTFYQKEFCREPLGLPLWSPLM